MAKKTAEKAVKTTEEKTYEIFTFGHISLDVIQTPSEKKEALGGAILHAAWVGHQLGINMGVLTKTAQKHKDRLKELPQDMDLYWVKSKETTAIVNIYRDESLERRDNFSGGQADSYTIKDFPNFNAKIIQYASLMQGEIDLSLVKALSEKGQFVLDAAGIIRKVMPDKTMVQDRWEDTEDAFPYVTFFKADAAESNFLTGIDTEEHDGRVQAAQQFLDWGAKEVILTHNSELLVVTRDGEWAFPFKNRDLSGRTGRGDNATTSYICSRVRDLFPENSCKFAAALTSLKMETPGPFKGTREDVDNYIQEFY